jgi:hypothetical protein
MKGIQIGKKEIKLFKMCKKYEQIVLELISNDSRVTGHKVNPQKSIEI